jgi:small-conductance mechanosensitive channel
VFKEPVFNYSADFPFLWDEIKLPIKYGSDYQLVRNILQRVANEVVGEYAVSARVIWDQMVRKYMIEKARIEPAVTLAANDNWVEFTLRYVVDYKQRRSTKDLLFTRLLDEIDRVPDKVGIASATFQLVDAPALDIRLSSRSE